MPRMKSRIILLAILMLVSNLTGQALAVLPDEMLKDPALEARARRLSLDIRCLVCQNQSIDDSNAALARDLRLIVRERLKAGDSDTEVIDYLVVRYGNYVSLKPPFQANTIFLWIGPAMILMIAGATYLAYIRRRNAPDGVTLLPLTEDERRQLAALVKDR